MIVIEALAALLLVAGTVFISAAALGVLRMPDVYCRLSATSKGSPFGIVLMLSAATLLVRDLSFAFQCLAVAGFLALTAPVAAHALARAARRADVPFVEGTRRDDRSQG